MVRFLGHGGPKVCAILHLSQLKQRNTFFLVKKKKEKKENPKEGHPRWSHLRATEPGYHVLTDTRIRIGCVSRSRGVDK